MPYPTSDITQMMGIGSYVGEVRQGPDGQLYEWVEGIDGLGNPVGFWKGIKSLVSKALPIAKFIPGIGPIIGTVKQFCGALPKLGPVIQQVPGAQPIYKLGTKICGVLGKVGLAGIGGGIMEGPDGQLYEVVEGFGEAGRAPRHRRRVWVSIPAVIRPRGSRLMVRPAVSAQPGAPSTLPAVPVTPVVPVAPGVPVARPAVPVTPAAPVRRFR